jgi:hypothetical protein
MAELSYLLEQIERCLRLAQDSTDPVARDNFLKLADEYAARAGDLQSAPDGSDVTVWQAGSADKDAD